MASDVPLMAQLAACRRRVGVCLVPAVTAWEVRGNAVDLDELARRLARRPARAATTPWGWWLRMSGQRALMVGDVAGDASLERVRADLPAAAPDVAVIDPVHPLGGIVLVGARAAQLAHESSPHTAGGALLPGGPDCWMLVLERHRTQRALQALLTVGGAYGALPVGPRAIQTHRAARRVLEAQRRESPALVSMQPISEGVALS